MAVYKLKGTFGNSFKNNDIISLFASSGSITPSTTTKFELEQGIFITVNNGVTVTAYASNGTCINVTDSVYIEAIPEPTTEFTCALANFVVNDGNQGATVTGSVSLGTLVSISPSTYSLGDATYTATITIPSGYSNTGDGTQVITCTDTGNGASTTQQYTQVSELQEGVLENPTYTITWPGGTQTVGTGDLGPKTKTVPLTATDILVYVTRTNPDPTVEDATQILFSRNGGAAEHTISKSIGDIIQTESYTFTSVSNNDILKVEIFEG